jgi:class 3 adenylate cyclase/putative methionine-R-sulfoxide reductase with GAF domain
MRLCQAENAAIWRLKDGRFYLGAHTSTDAGYVRWFVENPIPTGESSVAGRAVEEQRPVHVDDVQSDPAFKNMDLAERSKTRTMLAVPLFAADGEPNGAISLLHRVIKPFTPEQIALVETFADQAAIAIENVRLFSELQTRFEREKATREILEVISHSRDNEMPVFDVILKNAARLCHAPLANLNMVDEAGTNLVLVNDWGEPLKSIRPGHKWSLDSDLVIVRAVREGQVIHIRDLADDELYRRDDPTRVRVVNEEGVRTFLAVPLLSDNRTVGAIGLFRREVRPFTDGEIDLVKTFAAQAVIAVDNVKQFKALEARTEEVQALNIDLESRVAVQVGELERLGRLKRFLSPQVVDAVVSSGDESLLSSHRALIAVLFCDIRGFTAFCEMAEPEETIEILQTYHEEMGNLINAHGAGVDHRSGDGIMVIFNDPLPCDNPAGDALRMALAMRDQMATLCKDWRRLGHKLGFGVGISLGYATVGMVGSEDRYDYTASGTAVNLAARLCDEAADGEILLSPRAYTAVEDEFAAESAGELNLKGIHAPVEVFRVTSNRVTSERHDLGDP